VVREDCGAVQLCITGGRGRSAAYVAQWGEIVRRCTAERCDKFGRHLEHDKTLLHTLEGDPFKDGRIPTDANEHARMLPRTRKRTHKLARMHSRTLARRTRGALTYGTVGAATPWRPEQKISATRASKRRPSTRCKRKAKLRLDLAALRLVRVASREWGFRWVAVGDSNSSTHGDTHTKYEYVGI
jgi:hypothetical protein